MTRTGTTSLLPCPFCGGEAHVRIKNPKKQKQFYQYEVGCCNDECHGFYDKNWTVYESELDQLTRAWNTRAEWTCIEKECANAGNKCSWCVRNYFADNYEPKAVK